MSANQWRYCCPECGAHALVSRVRRGGYRCEVCKTVVERKYDKKHEELAP